MASEGWRKWSTGGVPAGASPDDIFEWATDRRRAFAAGELIAKQPQLRQKTSDTEGSVLTESDNTLDLPPEGDTKT